MGYTGHHYHVGSELVLTLYRAYDPEVGRWLSADPLGEAGGVNLYAYVGNNPINGIDPDGLDAEPVKGTNWNRHIRNPKNMANEGESIGHSGKPYDGQYAAGAQHETGDGNVDAPRAKTWVQGHKLSKHTPIGTLIAKGWIDKKYPNKKGTTSNNHTGTYDGYRNGKHYIRDQWEVRDDNGQLIEAKAMGARPISSENLKKYNEVFTDKSIISRDKSRGVSRPCAIK